MFTGIVTERGVVTALTYHTDDAATLSVRAPLSIRELALGDSIAVNGVCLTATELHEDSFSADVMKTTLAHTNLGELTASSVVNLELSMRLSERLSGHLVQGHVDDTVVLVQKTLGEHWEIQRYTLPEHLSRYVVQRGSVTLNGVSLTVSELGEDHFEVSLIPATLAHTNLGEILERSTLNLEVDVLAKYAERLLDARFQATER